MKKVALITGATGGLGRALALEHVRHGGDVILVARKATKVHGIAPGGAGTTSGISGGRFHRG